MSLIFQNASVLDVERGTLVRDQAVLVEEERIVEVGPSNAIRFSGADVIDLRGRVLMPGLIDCHVHVCAASANLADQTTRSPMYLAARCSLS
jgi:imidazolonepropionase-like amidohydrolase